MTRRKVKAMILRILMRMKNNLWALHQGGIAAEGNGQSPSRVRVYLTTPLNNLRKSTSRVVKKKQPSHPRRLLVRYS
jgi:hypothetical protein